MHPAGVPNYAAVREIRVHAGAGTVTACVSASPPAECVFASSSSGCMLLFPSSLSPPPLLKRGKRILFSALAPRARMHRAAAAVHAADSQRHMRLQEPRPMDTHAESPCNPLTSRWPRSPQQTLAHQRHSEPIAPHASRSREGQQDSEQATQRPKLQKQAATLSHR